jgi:glycosyltransferase involved in cell wall biosynthesis
MDCTIIICTRNRASTLEKTLVAFRTVRVPIGLNVELIVADNGSDDNTAEVIQRAVHPGVEIRHVYESRPGKSRAQNTAMAAARGDVLLFTDDDVVPAEDWIEKMSKPLLERRCEAVAGRILLAESLRRPWFTPMHEVWLAFIREPSGSSPELVGASMGIHRSVFDRISNFDEELGPGASGFGEETLLWRQMNEVGLRILPVIGTHVVHYPEESRLLRSSWLAAAARFGHTAGYVMYHWEHSRERFAAVQLGWVRLKLFLRSRLRRAPALDAEGCPAWEMSYLVRIETIKRFISESTEPRKYERHGLRKII